MKVIMVDDSPADRKLCRTLLQEIHGETHGDSLEFFDAAEGESGLEACRTIAPDCVLLDYELPDMTGLEFLSRLHSSDISDKPSCAVVILTGIASEQAAVEAMKAGAQDYLVKERMTAEALSLAVDKAIQKIGLIRELKSERDRLRRSLAEKEVLIKEVHHRVKNNLAVIASMLRLQATTLPEERLQIALRESQNRVESMALIHEQLYANGDLRQVDLAEHAALLASSLFYSYGVDRGRVTWSVKVEPLPLGVDQAIPAGLILNELVSNALRHGFPEGRRGSIVIEGGKRDGRIELAVRDDGVGLLRGVELARPQSLGMKIITILTRQLKGSFELAGGNPATFRISFPEVENGTTPNGSQGALQSAGGGG